MRRKIMMTIMRKKVVELSVTDEKGNKKIERQK